MVVVEEMQGAHLDWKQDLAQIGLSRVRRSGRREGVQAMAESRSWRQFVWGGRPNTVLPVALSTRAPRELEFTLRPVLAARPGAAQEQVGDFAE